MKLLDITLEIFRYRPGEQPHYDTFTVQVDETAHVIVPATIPRVVLVLCALMASKSFLASHVLAR